MGFPAGQPDGATFSIEVPYSQMTLACVTLTKKELIKREII